MTKRIKEADVEAYLVRRVETKGGLCEKFTSPNRVSVPDRVVSLPPTSRDWRDYPARVVFVECKAPGKKPTAAQLRDHERRRAMGFRVYVVDSLESVDLFLESEGIN